MSKWTSVQLSRLAKYAKEKPAYVTDYELSGRIARQFSKSPESVRWQLRQMRRDGTQVGPAKILLLDIETLPINADIWGVWNQNIGKHQIKKDWSIVTWAAKWLFSTEVIGESVKSKEAIERTDQSVLAGIWELVNQAHIVITHNGNGFDLKRLNTRWLLGGFPPPMFYQSIDTLAILKEKFDFTYNQLDYVNAVLGIGRKMDNDYHWWDEAGKGSKKYIDLMLDYNKQDVNILEELYLRLRPWMSKHPNLNVFAVDGNKVEHCPACGGVNLHWDGSYMTPLGLYKAFRCQDCGAIGRATTKKYNLQKALVQS